MGTYLSTPVLDKCEESGTDYLLLNQDQQQGEGEGRRKQNQPSRPVNWGVVDMQGWRKSMEDAHVARTDVPPPGAAKGGIKPPDPSDAAAGGATAGAENEEVAEAEEKAEEAGKMPTSAPAKVFAVFDGHGGPEVARFCQLYLVDVLTSQKEWNSGAGGGSADGGDEAAAKQEEENGTASTSTSTTQPNVGKALIESFHALDRMIDDPSRRDELTLLRSEKPRPGEYRSLSGSGAEIPDKVEVEDEVAAAAAAGAKAAAALAGSSMESEVEEVEEVAAAVAEAAVVATGKEEEKMKKDAPALIDEDAASAAATAAKNEEEGKDTKKEESCAENKTSDDADGDASDADADADADDTDAETDANSTATVGGGDSIINDGLSDDLDEDGNSTNQIKEGEGGEGSITTADAMALFQKLLTMSGASGGKVEVNIGDGDEGGGEGAAASGDADDDDEPKPGAADDGSGTMSEPAAATIVGPDASQPTRIQNGRQVCNLPDHPIHAGCTSVVAVLVGNTVTVANAGDSRAVLCRAGGVTEALSFDHKPLQDRERNRITAAGGFVNQFGRVNGNLNLSRSIGDMKYKQVPGIPPSGQMITAEPDIVQVTLNPADEFLILGCDGIWDCLTNEEAVKYVRDRIDEKTPIEIGREMLDEIISDDPRASQGIGGDNMTVMVIDLQPQSRSYFK